MCLEDDVLPIYRYKGELRDGQLILDRTADDAAIELAAGVMGVSIVGAGNPDQLAREAAEVHFREHPERTKVFIVVSSRPGDDGWSTTA